jgi:hypothetical protein
MHTLIHSFYSKKILNTMVPHPQNPTSSSSYAEEKCKIQVPRASKQEFLRNMITGGDGDYRTTVLELRGKEMSAVGSRYPSTAVKNVTEDTGLHIAVVREVLVTSCLYQRAQILSTLSSKCDNTTRVIGGDVRKARCLEAYDGHLITDGPKYRDLVLQVGR